MYEMNEMVERIAKALFLDDEPYESDITWNDIALRDRVAYRSNAKSAILAMREPEETAPKGVPVIVQGGLAMKKTGGEWFTGMEEPLYQRPLQWTPEWWMPLPTSSHQVEW